MPTLPRNFFQRILGMCETKPPADNDCWTYENGKIAVDLARAQELSTTGGAIRLEKKNLPSRVLVIHGDDGRYHAFENRCAHAKRRLDPVPNSKYVQCCSVGKSTFDYSGTRVAGSAKKAIRTFPVAIEGTKLTITV